MSSIWLILWIVFGVCVIVVPAVIIPIIVCASASSRARKTQKRVERTLHIRK